MLFELRYGEYFCHISDKDVFLEKLQALFFFCKQNVTEAVF